MPNWSHFSKSFASMMQNLIGGMRLEEKRKLFLELASEAYRKAFHAELPTPVPQDAAEQDSHTVDDGPATSFLGSQIRRFCCCLY